MQLSSRFSFETLAIAAVNDVPSRSLQEQPASLPLGLPQHLSPCSVLAYGAAPFCLTCLDARKIAARPVRE